MAHKGQQIYNKITTDRITFLQTRNDTDGKLLQFENTHAANGIGPVAHRHPLQEEVFIVQKGTLNITVAGVSHRLKTGESITVPPNVMHFWSNGSNEELHLITEFRPALHFEEIIETIAALSQKNKVDKKGNPDPIQMSATLNAFYGEFFLGTMPVGLQVFLFRYFGFILRKVFRYKDYLGYRK
jgi:quercetin dioxygenase-like cupin family protein